MKLRPLTQIDFYKADHRRQYPEGSELVYSNFTPRSDRIYVEHKSSKAFYDGKIVNFGLQGFIKWFLMDVFNTSFFEQPKEAVVAEYKRRMDTSLGVDAIPVDHIEDLHDLGYLPIEIKALPEGSRSAMKVPVLTIKNTLPEFFWLVNYLETAMSNGLWKSYTSATIAYEYSKILNHYYYETGAPKELIPLMCHDFSARGVSNPYDITQNGAAHLTSFVGTDSVSAIDYLEDYYNADATKELIGCSVPATEHSVMCMGGQEDELGTFKRLVTELYPAGIVSIVSDTWDFWKVITEYLPALKQDILDRTPNALGLAKVVIRPDSGDPVKIITGYKVQRVDDLMPSTIHRLNSDTEAVYDTFSGKYYTFEDHDTGYSTEFEFKEISEAEARGAVHALWETFGGTETELGYRMLHERIGLIYGDSITQERCVEILKRLKDKGYAASNVVFGIGSYTYQYNTRDTFGFAMKATYGEVNGVGRELFKDPVTDTGTKKSARGMLQVINRNGEYYLNDGVTALEEEGYNCLKTVFKDGTLIRETNLREIRARLADS